MINDLIDNFLSLSALKSDYLQRLTQALQGSETDDIPFLDALIEAQLIKSETHCLKSYVVRVGVGHAAECMKRGESAVHCVSVSMCVFVCLFICWGGNITGG